MELKDIDNLYMITFTIGIFWILMVEYFFEMGNKSNYYEVLLQWGSLIVIYIIAYIIYKLKSYHLKTDATILTILGSILMANLILIGVSILIMGQMGKIEEWNNYFESLVSTTFVTLVRLVGFAIPIFLCIIPFFHRK